MDYIKGVQGKPEMYRPTGEDEEAVAITDGEMSNAFADMDFDDLDKR